MCWRGAGERGGASGVEGSGVGQSGGSRASERSAVRCARLRVHSFAEMPNFLEDLSLRIANPIGYCEPNRLVLRATQSHAGGAKWVHGT